MLLKLLITMSAVCALTCTEQYLKYGNDCKKRRGGSALKMCLDAEKQNYKKCRNKYKKRTMVYTKEITK